MTVHRSETALHQLIEGLDGFIVPADQQVFGSDAEKTTIVTAVQIFDTDQPTIEPGALVLFTGQVPLRQDIWDQASAIVVSSKQADLAVQAAGATPVLIKARWASWTTVHSTATRMLAADWTAQAQFSLGPVSTLAALAQIVSEHTGASITIEDTDSNVLAYSQTSVDADPIRLQTILGGAVPSWRVAELEASGFLNAVRRSLDVVVRAAEADVPGRMAIAVRSEDLVIGSLWATVSEESDTGILKEVLREAARAASPLIVRETLHSLRYARREALALSTILRGEAGIRQSARVLDLAMDDSYIVLALDASRRDALEKANFHVRGALPSSWMLESGGAGPELVLAHVPQPISEDSQLLEMLRTHLGRAGLAAIDVSVGVGPIVESLRAVATSAESAMLVLRSAPAHAGLWVGHRGDVQARYDLNALTDVASEGKAGKAFIEVLGRLAAHDHAHKGHLLASLNAYLTKSEHATDAAKELNIHPNTMRYRLARIEELTGFDLNSPDARMHLRMGLLLAEANGLSVSHSRGE